MDVLQYQSLASMVANSVLSPPNRVYCKLQEKIFPGLILTQTKHAEASGFRQIQINCMATADSVTESQINEMNPKIDNYLSEGCGRCPLGGTSDCKVHQWPEELKKLRTVVLDCGLTEGLKWGVPCYTYESKNIVLISALRGYCAFSFLKGVLLKDPHKILEKPGPNSQSDRVIKFTSVQQINALEDTLKAYVAEAIEVEKAGLKVEVKQNPEPIPEEFQQKFDEDPFFKTAFEELTSGRQRGYILHFSQPKQSKTRVGRIEKCTPKILNGEGLHDKYSSKKKQ